MRNEWYQLGYAQARIDAALKRLEHRLQWMSGWRYFVAVGVVWLALLGVIFLVVAAIGETPK